MKKIGIIIVLLFALSPKTNSQWQQINSPDLSVNDILKLADGTILIGTGNGLFRSNDNFLSWDSTSVTNNVNLIQKDNFGNIYASVLGSPGYPSGYLFRSTDLGSTWTIPYDIIPDNPHNVLNIFINDSGYVFIIQRHGGSAGMYIPVLKSTDFGTTWSLVYYFFCACEQNSLGCSIIENVSGTLFVSYLFLIYPQYMFGYSIEKKVSGGNWTYYTHKFANNMYLHNHELYIATTSLYGIPSLGIIKSSDDGNTYVQLNNGFSNLDVRQLILTPEVFIAFNGDGIYRSLDEGNNWVRIDHTGLNGSIRRVYYDDNNILYACTNNGLYVFNGVLPVELTSFSAIFENHKICLGWITKSELNNHGFEIERSLDNTNWATIGFREGKGTTSEPQNYNYSDDISEISAQKLYYRLKQIDFNGNFEYSKIIEVEITPTNFSLSQNYPNPFNPSTKIQYAITSRQLVILKVFDVLGKEVATLVNEEKPAGSYDVKFDAAHLPSGVYFYQLRLGDYVDSKKMLLMK